MVPNSPKLDLTVQWTRLAVPETQRAFFEQLASEADFILDWQHLDTDRNIAASAAIMRGDPTPMRKMDELVREP
jgi:hypothetical protein